MAKNNEYQEIELRSDELQDIVGRIPSNIEKYGIIVISIVVFCFLGSMMFYRYENCISADINIISTRSPVKVVSHTDGLIKSLDVENNSNVRKGDILCIIENDAEEEDVFYVKDKIEMLLSDACTFIDLQNLFDDKKLVLGDVQIPFYDFMQKVIYYNESVSCDKGKILKCLRPGLSETDMYEADVALRDSGHFKNLHEKIFKLKLLASMSYLLRCIKNWENTYLLRSPINGHVRCVEPIEDNHSVQPGEIVFTVEPLEKGKLIGYVSLHKEQALRVKSGQKVIIEGFSGSFSNNASSADGYVSRIQKDSEKTDVFTVVVLFRTTPSIQSIIDSSNSCLPVGNAKIIVSEGSLYDLVSKALKRDIQ